MSSISGRFLYQFGITAAVAVMVSLLVSFTLTPMMSARCSRRRGCSTGGDGNRASRRGFYALDRSSLRAHAARGRWGIAWRSWYSPWLVMLSSIPLYTMVRQEYIPSDVDEAEFEVNVTAPEGTSLAAMDEVMRAVEKELRAIPVVRWCSAMPAAAFIGSVNTGGAYVRIAPHEERVFSFGRLWRETAQRQTLDAFQAIIAARHHAGDPQPACSKFPDLRDRPSAICRRSTSAAAIGRSISCLRGPDLEALADYAEATARPLARTRHHRRRHHAQAGQTRTARGDRSRPRRRSRRRYRAISPRRLRLMVGGDEKVSRFRDPSVNEDYDVQLRLTQTIAQTIETISRLYVPRAGGGLVRLDNLVHIVPAQSASRIDRLDRQRKVACALGSPRLCPGRSYRGAERSSARNESARRLHAPPSPGAAASWSAPLRSSSGPFCFRSSSCT